MKKSFRFSRYFLFVEIVVGLFLFTLFTPRKAFGQSAPCTIDGVLSSEFECDIAFRGSNAWHHFGTQVGLETEVGHAICVEPVPPDGCNKVIKPSMVNYGDSGLWVSAGDIYSKHSWSESGNFTIQFTANYEGKNIYFKRKIWVAAGREDKGGIALDKNNSTATIRASDNICGVVGNSWDQGALNAKIDFFFDPFGTAGTANNYIGKPGGELVWPGLASTLDSPAGSGWKTRDPGAEIVTFNFELGNKRTKSFTLRYVVSAIHSSGSDVYWTVSNIGVFLDCTKDHGFVPPTTPTPTFTPTPTRRPTPTPTSTNTPTPSPTPTIQKCQTVSGSVRNPNTGTGIPNATVRVWAMANSSCIGSWSWCGSGPLTTNGSGAFSTGCSTNMNCLRVLEYENAPGYQDSTVYPSGPAGSEIWDFNTIVLKNPTTRNCSPFIFYDVPIPIPSPSNTPTPTPTCAPTDPSRPDLKSPVDGAILAMTEVTMEWFAVPSWGNACLPGNENHYKVYLSSNYADTKNPDGSDDPEGLSNEGGNLKCNVDESTLQCFQDNLTNNTVYYWQVEANNGKYRKLSYLRNFFVDLSAGSWWQTKDGDVHSEGDLTSLIPSKASPRYLSLIGSGGVPGVVSYTGTLDLNGGYVSANNWQAKTNYPRANTLGKINFTYLKNRLNLDITKNILPSGNPKSLPTESGTYYSAENSELNGGTIDQGKKIVIFVDGNLTLKSNITVTEGSFFALITSGNLIFDGPVTKAQGFYLTNGILTVNDDGTDDNQFEGQGSFVAWEGVSFDRDIGAKGGTTPAELFTSRPDLYVYSPKEFSFKPFFFWEVAP